VASTAKSAQESLIEEKSWVFPAKDMVYGFGIFPAVHALEIIALKNFLALGFPHFVSEPLALSLCSNFQNKNSCAMQGGLERNLRRFVPWLGEITQAVQHKTGILFLLRFACLTRQVAILTHAYYTLSIPKSKRKLAKFHFHVFAYLPNAS
jgi:hypothetical protein